MTKQQVMQALEMLVKDYVKQLEQAGKIISEDKKAVLGDLANVAEATYCHFRSTYLQIRFVRLRNAGKIQEINAVLDEEIELAQRLHAVMLRDSRIGFEASNHYYYTANSLMEKVQNCERLKSCYLNTAPAEPTKEVLQTPHLKDS